MQKSINRELHMFRTLAAAASLCLSFLSTAALNAQDVVPVGAGSYASFPPASAGKGAEEMLARKFPLVGSMSRPIPTNKLWTHLLNGKPEGTLWMYPWRVDPREAGLELFLPLKWNENGSDPVAESPLKVEGRDFRTKQLLVKEWGDWTLSFRLTADENRHIDVTVGEGMPIVWLEPQGVDLLLKGTNDSRAIGSDGMPLVFPSTTRQFLISMADRTFGVILPPNATVSREGDALRVNFSGKSFAAIAALSKPSDLKLAAESAYAIPRDSKLSWTFDPEKGQVRTLWKVRTEPLAPGQADIVLQGWLAHHWRGAEHQLSLSGPEFLTSRGPLKTASGNDFELVYDFAGILPSLPAPKVIPGEHPYLPQRMEELLARRVDQPRYGDDSYWGGKDLLHFSQFLHFARHVNSPKQKQLKELSRKSLADWLTYKPGEEAHFFAWYPNWKALIGFKESYDSVRFNDQHFHYGYFTLSAALLGMEDPEFLEKYGPMLKLVAKQYANWDRKDDRFPFLRTFDAWAGHSWAGGLGSLGGNNQESTSEAMQSWIGLFLLGTMLEDAEMTAAAAMGYCMEARATMEYWFNEEGDILPKEYKSPIVGILWSGGNVFGTYFSGDPAWVYAIQCLPQSPGLDYLARKPEWSRKLYKQIMALRKTKEGSDDLAVMGDLGNCMLAQLSLIDPAAAAAEFDRLWDKKNEITHNSLDAARTYYQAHSYRLLGPRKWDVKLNLPTSSVYANPETKSTTYIAYNPQPFPVVVRATQSGKVIGSFVAASRQLTTTTKLDPEAKGGLAGTVPSAGDMATSRKLDALYAVYHGPLDPASLNKVRLEGKGKPEFKTSTLDGGRVLKCLLSGPLTPGESYRWQLPGSQTISFTLEGQPPLALESSQPAQGQERVPANAELQLTFNAPITAKSASQVRLEGKDAPALTPKASNRADTWDYALAGELQPDESYALVIPAGITSTFGDKLAEEKRVTFASGPSSCPPNIYAESFAGNGHWKNDIDIDWANAESPHTGQRAIKLTTRDKEGALALFNGSDNRGSGRQPVDLMKYRQVECWIKGTCDSLWIKIGHPVFDNKAFNQTHVQGVTQTYKRFTLDIPSPKNEINTVFEITVPAGATVYVDDIRFIDGKDYPKRVTKKPVGK